MYYIPYHIPYRFPIKRSGQSKATEYYLTLEKYNEYRAAYEGIDIDQEFKKMRQWCIDNGAKRKTERGMPAFMNRWLNEAYKKFKPYSTRSRTLEQDLNDRSWVD